MPTDQGVRGCAACILPPGFTDIAGSHRDLLLRFVSPEMLEQVGRVEHRHEDCFGQELWRSPGQAEDWWILVIEESGEMPVEHKRVRHNPFKRLRRDLRTRSYSVKEFAG